MIDLNNPDEEVVMRIKVTGTNHTMSLFEQHPCVPDYEATIDSQCEAIRLFMEQERQYLDSH